MKFKVNVFLFIKRKKKKKVKRYEPHEDSMQNGIDTL